MRSSTEGYTHKTYQNGLQNSNPMAPTCKELYFLPFSVTAASSQTYGYTFVHASPFKDTYLLPTQKVFPVNKFYTYISTAAG
jgi:hypothetical protein